MREKEETLLWSIALDLSNRHFSTGRKDVKLWGGELLTGGGYYPPKNFLYYSRTMSASQIDPPPFF